MASTRDRAWGAFLGVAVDDAVGTTLEFMSRDSYTPITDMLGGGPFQLLPGEWTDDTSMALALTGSIFARDGIEETDLMNRFCDWRDNGLYSYKSRCFDMRKTCNTALDKFRSNGNPIAGSTDHYSGGIGSPMRRSPVLLFRASNPQECVDLERRKSPVAQGASEAVEACAAFAVPICDAI